MPIINPFARPAAPTNSEDAKFADLPSLKGGNWCPLLTTGEDVPKEIPMEGGQIGMTLAGTRTFLKCLGPKCSFFNTAADKCHLVCLSEAMSKLAEAK